MSPSWRGSESNCVAETIHIATFGRLRIGRGTYTFTSAPADRIGSGCTFFFATTFARVRRAQDVCGYKAGGVSDLDG